MATLSNLYLKTVSSVLVAGGKMFPAFNKKLDNIKTVAPLYYKKNKSNAYKFEVYYPKLINTKLPVLFYIHGGGWATLDLALYKTLCKRFAQKGFCVINLNYPLASSTKVHLEDILASIEQCICYSLDNLQNIAPDIEVDTNSVYISGDSAGAHLSALLALRATNLDYANDLQNSLSKTADLPKYDVFTRPSILTNKIKGLFLFYGVYNFATVRKTRYPKINLYVNALFGNPQKENKEKMRVFSPINFVSSSFPPVFITSGEIDKLHSSQSLEFSKKLIEVGVKTQTEFFEKDVRQARHGFMTFDNAKSTKIIHQKIDEFLNWINN